MTRWSIRARGTAAHPTCFGPAGGCRCANTRTARRSISSIVGTGAGGGTLACKLAE